jgi:hypothetical protein
MRRDRDTIVQVRRRFGSARRPTTTVATTPATAIKSAQSDGELGLYQAVANTMPDIQPDDRATTAATDVTKDQVSTAPLDTVLATLAPHPGNARRQR